MNEILGMILLFGAILVIFSGILCALVKLMFPRTAIKTGKRFLFGMLCAAWAEILFIFALYLLVSEGPAQHRIFGTFMYGLFFGPFLVGGVWLYWMIPELIEYERTNRRVIVAKLAGFLVSVPVTLALVVLAAKSIFVLFL